MFSWDPDNVEQIAPFTPSCCQKKEGTWRVDDVDRISPFIPLRQSTWSIDDVDHIESFVPINNCPSPSSSSQYDTATSSPLSQQSPASPPPATNTTGTQESQTHLYPQLSPLDKDLETRASSSQSSGSTYESERTKCDLDSSAESYSASNSPNICSKPEECCPETKSVENKGYNLHALLRLIDTSNYSVAGNSSEEPHSSSSSSDSVRPSHNSDIDSLVEVLRRQFSSNERSSVEHAPVSTASSCSAEDVSDNDTPLLEDTEGSLEMSTEFVIQEPAEDKQFDVYFSPTAHDESNYMTGDYSDGGDDDDDDGPLPWEVETQATKQDLYNPYAFSRPCIAATNSFGRGIDLKTEEDRHSKTRLMDPDYVPTMGRGAILKTYTNRHRTDESLNKQLRLTLGVGYSNEATEHFWRGEQEEKECERRAPSPRVEVADESPASPLYPEQDIIYVSPGNTVGHQKPSPSKKATEGPRLATKKCSTPHKAASPATSSPSKKKKTTGRNRNALLTSLAIQNGAERPTTPGMPPGALTYVHSDTPDKFREKNEFHYEKEDFPPLC